MHFTFQQLRIFEAVARHLNFTRASEELFLTQPAISIQVKRLEENVGHALFEQVGKRIFLTGAGEEMLIASREILDRLNQLEGALDKHHGEISGPLRISVVTTAKYFMPHLLGIFLREHPKVEPKLNVTNRSQVLQRLKENFDDLAIMGQVPKGMELIATPFLHNELVVVAHPKHPLTGKKRITLECLAKERFLSREEGSGTRSAVDRLFTEKGLRVDPYMELGSGESIKQGVMAGIGVSVLSTLSLRLELAAGLMSILNVEGFPLLRPWHWVYPKGKQLSNTARAYLEFLDSRGERLVASRWKST
ncbi:MAG: LysR family transcriptional regulator [Gammaproteobacteria bacterium]|nr:LysR family transcriptional regulator [Gammaproteobacteria bacterium]